MVTSPSTGVRHFFVAESARFDSIYGGSRSIRERMIDLFFHRTIYLRFARTLDLLSPIEGKRILDAGCGPGHYLLELAARGAREVVGVDFVPEMLGRARTAAEARGMTDQVRLIAGDFLATDLTGPFDAGIAIGFFEYLRDPLPYLRRLSELVRGDLVISFPKRFTLRTLPRAIRYRMRSCYLRFFTAGEIRRLAASAGLRDVTVYSVSRDYLLHARTAPRAPGGSS
jgi:cyclopropane fatty-acyl-phospholipid synthase-like methyltransferase